MPNDPFSDHPLNKDPLSDEPQENKQWFGDAAPVDRVPIEREGSPPNTGAFDGANLDADGAQPMWAIRSVERPPPPTHRSGAAGRGKFWFAPVIAVLGVFAVAAGGVGFLLGRVSANSPAASGLATTVVVDETQPLVSSVPPTTAEAIDTGPVTTSATVPLTTSPPETEPPTTSTPSTSPQTIAPNTTSGIFTEGDTRRAVFKSGIVYLGGEVPSQAVADQLIERVAAVVGRDNVVSEYVINPAAPIPNSAPLHVADLVLFESGTAVIAEPFKPLLDLGTRLFQVNANVTVGVIAHTDSISTDEYNLDLSQRRADAVKQYWIDAGIDPGRITAIGKGEAEPIAPNDTTDGRRLNRRAEFIVTGILG